MPEQKIRTRLTLPTSCDDSCDGRRREGTRSASLGESESVDESESTLTGLVKWPVSVSSGQNCSPGTAEAAFAAPLSIGVCVEEEQEDVAVDTEKNVCSDLCTFFGDEQERDGAAGLADEITAGACVDSSRRAAQPMIKGRFDSETDRV